MGATEVSLLLKKLHYHWFWGLYVDEGRASWFDGYVRELLSNRDERDEAIAAQRQMDSRPFMIRVFHWLFSPSYGVRAYALAACQVLKEEGREGEDGWEALPPSVGFARQSLMRLCQKTLKSTALVVMASEGVQDIQPTLTTPTSPSFQVTQAMVEHFLILGKIVEAGDVLLMADFKDLARRQRIMAHPDHGCRVRGLFKIINDAIKAIHALLDPGSNQPDENLLSAGDATIDTKIEALRREIAEERAARARDIAEERAARARDIAEERAARAREREEFRTAFEAELASLRARVDALLAGQTAASATVAPPVAPEAVAGLLSMGFLRLVKSATAAGAEALPVADVNEGDLVPPGATMS